MVSSSDAFTDCPNRLSLYTSVVKQLIQSILARVGICAGLLFLASLWPIRAGAQPDIGGVTEVYASGGFSRPG